MSIKVKPNSNAWETLRRISFYSNTPKFVTKKCENLDNFELDEIRQLKDVLREDGVYLHELMEECELILPQLEVVPRNPVLEARIQKLRLEQDERDYKQMTRNVDCGRYKHSEDTIASQINVMNRQLIGVFQFVLSIVCSFAFGFVGLELMVGPLDMGFRLLVGIIFGLIVGLAELYFLAVHFSQDIANEEL